MEVKVLGAAREVGRSGFQVNCDGTNLLLDYGVMFGKPRGSPPTYPLHVKPRDIDSVIITHAHLDHSGCVPSLFVYFVYVSTRALYFFIFLMYFVVYIVYIHMPYTL